MPTGSSGVHRRTALADLVTLNAKRLVMSIRSEIVRQMEEEGVKVARAVDKAVIEQGAVTKAQARTLAGGIFGPRAANTIGVEVYSEKNATSNKPGEAVAQVFSRWIRKTGAKRSDIWNAWEQGATIRPVLADRLIIGLSTSKTIRRRGFNAWRRSDPKIGVVPLGQGNLLITRRLRKQKKGEPFEPEALLLKQVVLQKKIDFDQVRRSAYQGLYDRVTAYLNRAN